MGAGPIEPAPVPPIVTTSSAPEVEAYRLMRAGRFSEALDPARRAVAAQVRCTPAHAMLAALLIKLGRAEEAESVVNGALRYQAGCADAYDGLAHASMLLGQHERSNSLYRRVVQMAPEVPRFWYNLASSHRGLGRLDDAEMACNRAILLDHAQYPSYLLRSELRVQSQGNNHVEALQAELARPGIDDRARMFLGYALGKELDDLNRHDEAFGWFQAAAGARQRHLSYDVSVDERKLRRIREAFTEDVVLSGARNRATGGSYVFVVGLPRSGTTLVERILMGLPGVRSNGETENFSQALFAGSPTDSRDVFSRAADANPDTVASNYAALASRRDGATVIEKLPMNYLYLGAIYRALPEAKLVVVNRAPLDSCFAMYRTLFRDAYPFTYDFDELARYHAAYDLLKCHWQRIFGSLLHEISYEELVADPERVGAALARHCGLEWNARAIDVQNNPAVSLTASAAQIRRPIYATSSGRWRHYERHLTPLMEGLRRHGVSAPGP